MFEVYKTLNSRKTNTLIIDYVKFNLCHLICLFKTYLPVSIGVIVLRQI